MSKSNFGIIGLGVMGRSLATNMVGKGISLSVYNRVTPEEKNVVPNFLNDHSTPYLQGHTNLTEFVNSLERPRKILLMIPAGDAVDAVLALITPLLHKGDILIDGGNSQYTDTQRRSSALGQEHIHYLGVGISGGEEGALTGPSMMPGGSEEGYAAVSTIIDAIAAKDQEGRPCASLLGPDGCGHFVKTIHNGIEYAEMQLLAECYALLRPNHSYDEIARLFGDWNQSELSSFLLEITIGILQKKEGDAFLLDKILDKANSKGTGTWSSLSALQLGVPATLIGTAVNARFISMLKEKRLQYSHRRAKKGETVVIDSVHLRDAYAMARMINHQQGFAVIKAASESNHWNLNLSEIARIWTNGCIIKSRLMEEVTQFLKQNDDLFLIPEFFEKVQQCQTQLREILANAATLGIATPCLSGSMQYWLSITSESLPANLIQAQRDYFGAHTYKRTDKPDSENFTTNWKSNG